MFKTHLLHVWETWMILCNKRLLVDFFLICSLSLNHLHFVSLQASILRPV